MRPSHTYALTEYVKEMFIKEGNVVTHWNLLEKPLPFHDPNFHNNQLDYPNSIVIEFIQLAIAADAFVFSSPIYHNSYSGVLKNALDHLTMHNLSNKPVGLMSHGGNRSSQAVDHLRIVTRGLLGHAISTQVCTANEDYKLSAKDYQIISASIKQRIDRFKNELITLAYLFRMLRNQ